MVKLIRSEDVASELPPDSAVWFLVVKGDEDNHVLTPDLDVGDVLWLFLKKEDAEHYAHLVTELAPGYKGKELVAIEDKLQDVRENAIHYKQQWGLIGPNGAMTYFKEYSEFLADYYK
jgi:hypothetical protein